MNEKNRNLSKVDRSSLSSELGIDGEPRLIEILDQILVAREQGESIDVEALKNANPDLADRIQDCLVSLEAIEFVAAGTNEVFAENRPYPELDDYRVIRELGRGGMGIVYEAHQISLNRAVALKVLPFPKVIDKKQVTRFQNESLAAAQLDHPNIVQVYSVGSQQGTHFYSMQLIDGVSVREFLDHKREQVSPDSDTQPQGTPRPGDDTSVAGQGQSDTAKSGSLETDRINSRSYVETVCRLIASAARGLEHAHLHSVIHRDIKPANLMIDSNGDIRITDFGLARLELETGITSPGDVVGTLKYMSPEQAMPKSVVDHRTDIYSLGLTLYEMLTLRPAVDATDRQQLFKQILEETTLEPRKLNSAVSRTLETIVVKATEKDRERRYNSAGEFAEDLLLYLDNRPIKARPQSLLDRVARKAMRHRQWVAAGIVGLLVLSAGLAISNSMVKSALKDSVLSKRESDTFLKESLIESARSLRYSGRQGRQVQAIEKLAQATRLANSLETLEEDEARLRSEAIASWTWSDLKPLFELQLEPGFSGNIKFDANLETYVRVTDDEIRVGNVQLGPKQEKSIARAGTGGALFVSPDGSCFTNFLKNQPVIYSTEDPTQKILLPDIGGGPCSAFDTNPSRTFAVYSKMMPAHFVVYDLVKKEIAFTRKRHSEPQHVTFSARFLDDNTVILPGTTEGNVFENCRREYG